MKWRSRLLLALAVLVHLGLLAGWRWQRPLVLYFFGATELGGGRGRLYLASGVKRRYNRLKYGESEADHPVSFD
jgi:hypothetical protein